MAAAEDRYTREAGTVQHGRDYEAGLAALLLARALRRHPGARLGINVPWAGKFDDVVLLLPGPEPTVVLVQLKHTGGQVSRAALLRSNNFGLPKYLASFAEIRSCPEAREMRHSLQCVLYTNAPLTWDVPALEPAAEPALAALLATGPGPIGQLPPQLVAELAQGPEPEPGLLEEFADRLLLCAGQADEEDLPALLAQELARGCGLLPDLRGAASALLEAVRSNCQQLAAVEYLSADSAPWAELRAALSRQTRAPDGVRCGEAWAGAAGRQLQQLTEGNSAVAAVLAGCAQLRSCALMQALAAAQPPPAQPLLLARATDAEDALRMWQRGCGTLLLDTEGSAEDPQLADELRAAQENSQRRLVLAAATAGGWLPRALAAPELTLPPLRLDQLSEASRAALLTEELSLQGRPLGGGQTPRFLQTAGPELAALLLRPGPAPELGSSPPPPPALYEQRQLQVATDLRVRARVLRDSSLPDLFLVEGYDRDRLLNEVKTPGSVGALHAPSVGSGKYFPSPEGEGGDYFDRLVPTRGARPLHWLRRAAGGLRWVASAGDPAALARHTEPADLAATVRALGGPRFGEQQLLAAGPRLLLLSAEPGLGKTSLLRSLAQRALRQRPRRWVLLLGLAELSRQLSELSGPGATREEVQRLLEAGAAPLEAQLLREAVWSSGESDVFVDAYDEIAPDYVPAASALLRQLAGSAAARLWVATRPVTRPAVQAALGPGGLILGLRPLRDAQQQQLLAGAWRQRGLAGPRLEARAGRLLAALRERRLLDRGAPLSASPLTVALLAQVFEHAAAEDSEFDTHMSELSLYWLYSQFVEKTFVRHCVEKQGKDMSKPAVRREAERLLKPAFLREHCLCALAAVLAPAQLAELAIPGFDDELEDFAERAASGEEQAGLVVAVSGGRPAFLHRTLAEFLAARWLGQHWESRRGPAARLLREPELAVVREFLDHSLAAGLPLHRAVLRWRPGDPLGPWSREQARARDPAGRSALHLAAQAGHRPLLEALLELGAELEAADELHRDTPLYYAAGCGQWVAAGALVERGAAVRADVARLPAVRRALAATECAAWPAFEAEWRALQWDGILWFPLHAAAQSGDEECARLLLDGGAAVDPGGGEEWFFTPLHWAARGGHLGVARLLLERGAAVGTGDGLSRTPLHLAAERGHAELLALLARWGADPAAEDKRGRRARQWAEQSGFRTAAELLRRLEAGADPQTALAALERDLPLAEAAEAGDLQQLARLLAAEPAPGPDALAYALLRAAHRGRAAAAAALLDRGADPAVADGLGRTALHWAAEAGWERLARLLLRRGADPSAADWLRRTPLQLAAWGGHFALLAELCLRRAEPAPAEERGLAAALELLRRLEAGGEPRVALASVVRDLPLAEAAEAGDLEQLARLLAAEPAPGPDALAYALLRAAQEGRAAAAAALLDRGAEPNPADGAGRSALHWAAEGGHRRLLALLAERGADLQAEDREGRAARRLAEVARYPEAGELLRRLEAGAEPQTALAALERDLPLAEAAEAGDLEQLARLLAAEPAPGPDALAYALLRAAHRGRAAAAAALLDRGAEPSAEDGYGHTALHWAARGGHEPVARLALRNGAAPNAADSRGRTALHWAAKGGHEAVARALLDHRADPDIADENLRTALFLAASAGHTRVLALLVLGGARPGHRDVLRWTARQWAEFWEHRESAELLRQLEAGIVPQGGQSA